MRAKSDERLQAEKLRCELGLSYSEIAERTGVSKSTLSNWLRDIPLTPKQEARLQGRLRALPINRSRTPYTDTETTKRPPS